ncbi:unnamed protein product, partial [marine sediment metagenome]
MDMLIAIFVATLLSLGFTIFYVNRASKQTRITLNSLGGELSKGIEDINSQLEPIMKTNSIAMGHFSNLRDDDRIENTLDRKIGLDVMDQYGDIYEGIKLAFPRVAEYLDDRPEAITKLLPRLNTLISDPDTRKRLNLDLSGAKG